MKTIYKYPIDWIDTHEIPVGAKFLFAGLDPQERPCVWFEVDPSASRQIWTFKTFGTGFEIDSGMNYLGSWKKDIFVWHLYTDGMGS